MLRVWHTFEAIDRNWSSTSISIPEPATEKGLLLMTIPTHFLPTFLALFKDPASVPYYRPYRTVLAVLGYASTVRVGQYGPAVRYGGASTVRQYDTAVRYGGSVRYS